MSGYGGYYYDFTNWKTNNTEADGTITDTTIHITNAKSTTKPYMYLYPYTLSKMKIEVEGIIEGQSVVFTTDGGAKPIIETVSKDGVYEIDWTKLQNFTPCISLGFIGECDIVIKQLPEYEGALVFDGVDDYVSLDAFDSGFKTMFMVCNPFKNVPATIIYDQRYLYNSNYAIFTANNRIAYEVYNQNKTFINNKENTKLICNELLNKKHLIHVLAEEIYEGIKLRIGSSVGNNQYTNMALYKFLGFKEALTEEQINAIIKKYDLLDGVDEIEVS